VRLYNEVIIGYSRSLSHTIAYISTKRDFHICSLLSESSLVLISTNYSAARNLIAIATILRLHFNAKIAHNENLIVTYDPFKEKWNAWCNNDILFFISNENIRLCEIESNLKIN
jgi:hypothetical protein